MIPITVICLALVAALFYEKRQNAIREAEREQAWRLERTGLLNRIQIPEAAPFIESGPEESQHIPWEDDEAFNEAQRVLAEVAPEVEL